MTEKQDKFIETYVATGNATQAAIAAGYSEKTARAKGYQLKNQLHSKIQEEVQKSIADKIPSSLKWLSDLAENAESESVRLGAIKDILDRAGLKPVDKVETTTIEQMSADEIRKELESLGYKH
ncbi:MAG: terminase small subunit [Betaproteobacteria bacterium]|jgi:predicted house-cleaning noncanonical NTP pyrophosphatase (MazG superfamily)